MRNFHNENYYDFISEIISVVRVSFIFYFRGFDSILFWVKVKLRLKANYNREIILSILIFPIFYLNFVFHVAN